jgi:hypothetical protein
LYLNFHGRKTSGRDFACSYCSLRLDLSELDAGYYFGGIVRIGREVVALLGLP